MTTPEQREKFEKWALTKGLSIAKGPGGLGGYQQMGTGFALWGYEAALSDAHTPPEVESVRIPTSANEAELMAKLGMSWLEQNAPERLKDTPPEVEPYGYLYESDEDHFFSYVKTDFHSINDTEVPLYTSPPSPNASYDAEGNPLNLMAAADWVCKWEMTYGLFNLAPRINALRKFIGDQS